VGIAVSFCHWTTSGMVLRGVTYNSVLGSVRIATRPLRSWRFVVAAADVMLPAVKHRSFSVLAEYPCDLASLLHTCEHSLVSFVCCHISIVIIYSF